MGLWEQSWLGYMRFFGVLRSPCLCGQYFELTEIPVWGRRTGNSPSFPQWKFREGGGRMDSMQLGSKDHGLTPKFASPELLNLWLPISCPAWLAAQGAWCSPPCVAGDVPQQGNFPQRKYTGPALWNESYFGPDASKTSFKPDNRGQQLLVWRDMVWLASVTPILWGPSWDTLIRPRLQRKKKEKPLCLYFFFCVVVICHILKMCFFIFLKYFIDYVYVHVGAQKRAFDSLNWSYRRL